MESKEDKVKWRLLLHGLRKHFPANYPVDVRRCVVNECFGIARFHNEKFYVRIDRTVLPFYQRDALVHEWAHTLADDWRDGTLDVEAHPEAWGIAYAKIYSAWLTDFGKIAP